MPEKYFSSAASVHWIESKAWILQADQMVKAEWFSSVQMQALDPALVMILIPFNILVLYPVLRRWGVDPARDRQRRCGFNHLDMQMPMRTRISFQLL